MIIAAWLLSAALPALADEVASPLACLDEIKVVCMGLEDHLETCSDQRGRQLSDKCRDLLKSALNMAGSASGPGACVADIKLKCSGLEGPLLTQCIIDQKDTFAPACRAYLEAASPKATSETHADR